MNCFSTRAVRGTGRLIGCNAGLFKLRPGSRSSLLGKVRKLHDQPAYSSNQRPRGLFRRAAIPGRCGDAMPFRLPPVLLGRLASVMDEAPTRGPVEREARFACADWQVQE